MGRGRGIVLPCVYKKEGGLQWRKNEEDEEEEREMMDGGREAERQMVGGRERRCEVGGEIAVVSLCVAQSSPASLIHPRMVSCLPLYLSTCSLPVPHLSLSIPHLQSLLSALLPLLMDLSCLELNCLPP